MEPTKDFVYKADDFEYKVKCNRNDHKKELLNMICLN